MSKPNVTEQNGSRLKLSRRIYNFCVKQWWLSSVIASLPAGYSVLLQFYGRNVGIVKSDGTMEILWVVISTIVLLISTAFILLRFYADVNNQKKNENAVKVYREIIKSNEKTNNDRRMNFLEIIREGNYKGIAKASLHPYDNPRSGLNPLTAIKKKMEDARTLLGILFGIDPTCVSMSIIHQDEKGSWRYLHSLVASGHGDRLSTFLTNGKHKKSAFYAAREQGMVFYPDKRIALDKGCYILDQEERRLKQEGQAVTGSIFCEDISVKLDNEILLSAVFCVNTYGKQVCAEGDEPAKDKVMDLFRGIESDIMLELTRICVYEHIGIRRCNLATAKK